MTTKTFTNTWQETKQASEYTIDVTSFKLRQLYWSLISVRSHPCKVSFLKKSALQSAYSISSEISPPEAFEFSPNPYISRGDTIPDIGSFKSATGHNLKVRCRKISLIFFLLYCPASGSKSLTTDDC